MKGCRYGLKAGSWHGFRSWALLSSFAIAIQAEARLPAWISEVKSPCSSYSLINSVDFHPKENLFCVTYTQGNQVVLYEIDAAGIPNAVQSLRSQMSEPQHAVFSPSGETLVVANWTNQTLVVYGRQGRFFQEKPLGVISCPAVLARHKPHGISFSPSGRCLAVAYGAAPRFGKAIALFEVVESLPSRLISYSEELPGIPKGITFSPDGTCLLVTFSDIDSLAVFEIESGTFKLRQMVQGRETEISRPEDVKISPAGDFCAVSNSDRNTIIFYPFDSKSNRITATQPLYSLQNPAARLSFPHGIAFSNDGAFFSVTEFGPIQSDKGGDLTWHPQCPPSHAKIHLYRLDFLLYR